MESAPEASRSRGVGAVGSGLVGGPGTKHAMCHRLLKQPVVGKQPLPTRISRQSSFAFLPGVASSCGPALIARFIRCLDPPFVEALRDDTL